MRRQKTKRSIGTNRKVKGKLVFRCLECFMIFEQDQWEAAFDHGRWMNHEIERIKDDSKNK